VVFKHSAAFLGTGSYMYTTMTKRVAQDPRVGTTYIGLALGLTCGLLCYRVGGYWWQLVHIQEIGFISSLRQSPLAELAFAFPNIGC
jgi:hypothetical protein